MSRKKFYLIAAGAVLLYLLFLFLAFKLLAPSQPKFVPVPKNSVQVNKAAENSADRIVNIMDKLPYKGTNFTLSYDSNTGGFILNINPSNKSAGSAEFEDFLKQNGVLKSDLDSSGLTTTYK